MSGLRPSRFEVSIGALMGMLLGASLLAALPPAQAQTDAERVAVLPSRGFRLLMFTIESLDRIRFVGHDCALVRVGASR